MLGLAFHELLDNAFRFGALSTAAGQVDVRWKVEKDDNESQLRPTWDERGSGHVTAVKPRPGFGFELLTIGLPEALGRIQRPNFGRRACISLCVCPWRRFQKSRNRRRHFPGR